MLVKVWKPESGDQLGPELEGGSDSLQKVQNKGRCAYQGLTELKREQGVLHSLTQRGKRASSNLEKPTSGNEQLRRQRRKKPRIAFTCCSMCSSSNWRQKHPGRETSTFIT